MSPCFDLQLHPPHTPQAIAIICKIEKKTLRKLEGDLFSGGAKCLKLLLKDDEPEKVCSMKIRTMLCGMMILEKKTFRSFLRFSNCFFKNGLKSRDIHHFQS